MPVFGITGGIATGKTLLTSCLAEGRPEIAVFDSDACARRLTEEDAAVRELIRAEFGADLFDGAGQLNRPMLREIVFNDSARREALEAILHPAIRREWTRLAEDARAKGAALLVDIPLLFETGAEIFFDKVVAVACSAATQRQRLMENRRLSSTLADRIAASQLPQAEKLRRADFVVWNDGSPAALRAQADLLRPRLFAEHAGG